MEYISNDKHDDDEDDRNDLCTMIFSLRNILTSLYVCKVA